MKMLSFQQIGDSRVLVLVFLVDGDIEADAPQMPCMSTHQRIVAVKHDPIGIDFVVRAKDCVSQTPKEEADSVHTTLVWAKLVLGLFHVCNDQLRTFSSSCYQILIV